LAGIEEGEWRAGTGEAGNETIAMARATHNEWNTWNEWYKWGEWGEWDKISGDQNA